jgi:hypothetical protein
MEKQTEFAFSYGNAAKQVKDAVADQFKNFNKMMDVKKENSLNPVLDNIRAGHFIVGSFSTPGGLTFSSSPVLHTSADAARIECKRLASLNPGRLYLFVRLSGAELVPTQHSVSV